MFTGIIETIGRIEKVEIEKSNKHFWVSSSISAALKIDQSVAHNGVCLTVVEINQGQHRVTAIKETLEKSNLCGLKEGAVVNIERCTPIGGRMDGHIVQGHVDTTGTIVSVKETDGSWEYDISYIPQPLMLTVAKGSITVNGVSLTVVKSDTGLFSVAIIPYTYENTNFNRLAPGSCVNIEFDVIGKYVAKLLQQGYLASTAV